jgi:type IV pilus assembly protein PilY1
MKSPTKARNDLKDRIMNRKIPRWTMLTACAALSALSGMAVHADDTEIYLGQPTTAAEGRPNILFIIDTSGSMAGEVSTQVAYDPATVYDGDCPQGRIYWKSATANLRSVPVSRDNCELRDDDDATGWVDADKFLCKTAKDVIDLNGFQPVTRTAQWRPAQTPSNRKWSQLRRPNDGNNANANPVECADDSDPSKMDPPHGDGSKGYAANGTNGPFTSEEAQRINWSGSAETSGTYTYYSSNYLNWYFNARLDTKTRLEIVQEVATKTLNGISNVNVGLMRFSTDAQGGMVLHQVADLATAKTSLITQIDGLNPSGNTPLAETMYEAALYWMGKNWDYGSRSSPSHSVRASRTSADDSKYLAPISSSCQRNFIIYLTDGEPTGDTGANEKIQTMVGAQCTANTGGGASNNNGKCLDDLADYLYHVDLSTQDGLQNVTTYTVGFGADVQGVAWATELLRETARRGGGAFYEASDTATLTSVFTNIVQEILAVNTTFTAPTVAVNAFNRTQNLDDLFITLFGTSSRFHWPGNIKKYEVEKDGTIVDQTGSPAVDPATGFFRTGARSFWSAGIDGGNVGEGGAAHKILTPAARKLYTDIGGSLLSAPANAVTIANTPITAEMLGGLDPTNHTTLTRDAMIQWVRGADIDAETAEDREKPRFVMGDPLHARPATVIYGGTAANPDMVLFAATNDGYLHAIDPQSGEELWSYIPGHLLRRMTNLYINKTQPAKQYGLDGSLRALKLDANGNGIVDGTDKVYLFFGMGRGGQSYFGLDVTNKNAPKLLWRRGSATEINANGSALPATEQLRGLAQTWSTPVATHVKIGNDVKTVVIFGGGYDTSQDNVAHNTDDTGNRIFMLDAVTGEPLWRAGPTESTYGLDGDANFKHAELKYSIPGDIRVLDLDNNGLADRMYAADMGGRVWRFDIHNGNTANTLVTGGVFAALGFADSPGTGTAKARRFYYAPDVSLVRTGTETYLNIAIGSGYRGHPLNKEIEDRFYSLRDYQPFTAGASFTPITENTTTLIDVTTNITPTIPAGAAGWKINLESAKGEKVLAEARTFDDQILFTTYLPNTGAVPPGSNVCVPRQGSNRLYTVNVRDGSPVTNRDDPTGPDGTNTRPDSPTDRWGELSQGGIAPEVVILFPETSDPTCIVGVEQCGVDLTNEPVRTFWNRKGSD